MSEGTRSGPRLTGPDPVLLRRLREDGLETVEDVLRRAQGVRDLADRSNHRLAAGGLAIHVKRNKPRGLLRRAPQPLEARAIDAASAAGVPTAPLVFHGRDPRLGSVTGTADLAPALPLDRCVAQGRLNPAARRACRDDLAAILARLHGAGLHHRDCYLNHVFCDLSGDRPRLLLIDLERLGRHRRRLSRWVVKDLAALESSAPAAVGARERLAFLLAYLRRRGIAPRDHARGLIARVARKARRIRAHAPRTPVGAAARIPEPLAPRP